MEHIVYLHDIKFLAVGIEKASQIVINHIPKKSGDYFCFADVHLVMECHKDPELKNILNNSAANFPDGMGVAWALKLLGHHFEGRVRGTDLMFSLCSIANKNGLKIFLYGNTEKTLLLLQQKLKLFFPNIRIIGAISPPFRDLTEEEDRIIVSKINENDPDILFVSLGAPKQERWMAEHKGRVRAVQLGIGAAFDFITGRVKQAPVWMQKAGLEWFFRLPQQPKKVIFRMCLVPEFAYITFKQLIGKNK